LLRARIPSKMVVEVAIEDDKAGADVPLKDSKGTLSGMERTRGTAEAMTVGDGMEAGRRVGTPREMTTGPASPR